MPRSVWLAYVRAPTVCLFGKILLVWPQNNLLLSFLLLIFFSYFFPSTKYRAVLHGNLPWSRGRFRVSLIWTNDSGFLLWQKKICGSSVGFLWSKVKNVRLKVAQPEADWLYDNLSMKVDYHVTSLIQPLMFWWINLVLPISLYIGKLDENINTISSLSLDQL